MVQTLLSSSKKSDMGWWIRTALTTLLALSAPSTTLAQQVLGTAASTTLAEKRERKEADLKKPGEEIGGQLVVFDAATGTFSGPKKLDARAKVTILVKNVNYFREKYEVSVTRTNFITTQMPEALKSILISSPPGPAPAGAAMVTPSGASDLVKTSITAFQGAETKFYTTLKLEKSRTLEEIVALLRGASNNEMARRKVVGKLHEWYASGKGAGILALVNLPIGEKEKDQIAAFQTAEILNSRDEVSRLIRDLGGNLTQLRDKAEELATLGKKIKDDLIAAGKDSATDATIKDISERLSWVNSALEDQETKAKEFAYLYDLMLQPRYFPTTKVVEAETNADQIAIKVKVTQEVFPLFKPEDSAGLGQETQKTATAESEATDYIYQANTYGRIVRDFSLGFAETTLRKQNYFVAQPVGSASGTKGIFLSDSDARDGQWSALAHFYPRTNLPLGASLAGTIGLMPDTNRTRYLVGGSLVLEPSNRIRIYLSTGWSYGKVERLNGTVNSGGYIPLDPTSALVRPQYETVNRFGFFRALTFSFSF